MRFAKDLPQKSFSNGKPLDNREQFVLMAAKSGESATNRDAEKTGLFTKELMAQLANQSNNEWPPNMEMLREKLSQRFVELKEAGKTEQTPTVFYYKDWHSNEGTLGEVPVTNKKAEDEPDNNNYGTIIKLEAGDNALMVGQQSGGEIKKVEVHEVKGNLTF